MSAQSSVKNPETSGQEGPPALPYSLRDHKKKIALIWGLIILDSCIAPLLLFYPLGYATSLDWQNCKMPKKHDHIKGDPLKGLVEVFAITTSAFGLVTLFEYLRRGWRLVRRDNFSRPLGGKRKWVRKYFPYYSLGC